MEQKDLFIFVCATVGRAMGNPANDKTIHDLTKEAIDVFEAHFGKPEHRSPPLQQPYSPMSAQEAIKAIAPPEMVAMPQPTLPEGKPFEVWRKDKTSSWAKPFKDMSWEMLLQNAKGGNGEAINAINQMAADEPGSPDDKWYKANLRRITRAKAIKAML